MQSYCDLPTSPGATRVLNWRSAVAMKAESVYWHLGLWSKVQMISRDWVKEAKLCQRKEGYKNLQFKNKQTKNYGYYITPSPCKRILSRW